MTTCVDLAARFGNRYRLTWEADGVTPPLWPREDWPWLMEIRCRHGLVHPYGGELLSAFTDKPRIGTKLRQLPFLHHARGDLEVVVHFHVDDLPAVLAILKPYRRRQELSPAQRAALAAGRRPFRKKDGAHVENRDFPDPESARELEPSPAPQSEAARASGAPEGLVSGFQAEGKNICQGGNPWRVEPSRARSQGAFSARSLSRTSEAFSDRSVGARPHRPAAGDDGP